MRKILIGEDIYLFSKKDNPKVIAVFSHSLSDSYESPLAFSILEKLYKNDIGIIVFNFLFARNKTKPSLNLVDEKKYLNSIIYIVKERFSPEKIITIGKSLGGVISVDCCSNNSHLEISSIFVVGFPFKLGFPPNFKLLSTDNPVLPDYFSEYDDLFKTINKSVFIIQGDHDDLGDIDECRIFFDKYKNCNFSVIKDANHGFVSYKNENVNYYNECAELIINKIIS